MLDSGRKVTRLLLALLAVCALVLSACGRDDDESSDGGGDSGGTTVGLTDTEIKLGTTFPLSGPASAYATISRASKAYFDWVNSKGGVHGRKISYKVLDDGYDPAKAVQNARRLITQDKVFALFNPLGTPVNLAIWDFVNQQKVPHLFVATGASEWGKDIDAHPWTIGWQPDYVTEANAFAQYLKDEKPSAKVAVLYQNDGFGKDLLGGFEKAVEGSEIEIVAKESYEVTDPSVAPQVKKLAGSGADTFLDIATPKPTAQALATVAKSDWKPLHLISNVSSSKTLVFKPVGMTPAKGVISNAYLKDPDGEQYADDPAMQEYKKLLKQYGPRLDPNEPFNVYGWSVAETMVKTLEQAGKDLTRENVMEAARNLDTELSLAIPGVKVQTGEGDGYPIQSIALQRFDGENWEVLGEPVESEG